MAKHTKAELLYISRIKGLMSKAGIYEDAYEIQIEKTAENMASIDDMRKIVKDEGRVLVEDTTAGNKKHIAHPLIPMIQNAEGLLVRQLGALGLNKTQEKKSEAREKKREQLDGIQTFYKS